MTFGISDLHVMLNGLCELRGHR